jgi:hypothetical protein
MEAIDQIQLNNDIQLKIVREFKRKIGKEYRAFKLLNLIGIDIQNLLEDSDDSDFDIDKEDLSDNDDYKYMKE